MSLRSDQRALYGGGLTSAERDLRDQVCSRARTLHDRLRGLAQINTLGVPAGADVEAVRGWLFTIHGDDLNSPRASWSTLPNDE